MSHWSRSLALDGRDSSLKRWIVLGQLFPTEGLIGVSETSVDGETYESVMSELDVDDPSSVHLSSIERCHGRASKWFMPGDVVCRYSSIEEPLSDIVRVVDDIWFLEKNSKSLVDMESIEESRRSSIERNKWTIDRKKLNARRGQLVIIDPFGRALIVVETFVMKRWRKVLDRALCSRLCRPDVDMEVAGWLAIKAIHGRAFEMQKHGGCVDWDALTLLIDQVFEMRGLLSRSIGYNDRLLKMRMSFAPSCSAWWERLRDAWEDGASLPYPLRMRMEHPTLRWIMVSVRDVEESLAYAFWKEWTEKRSPFKVKAEGRPRTGQKWH